MIVAKIFADLVSNSSCNCLTIRLTDKGYMNVARGSQRGGGGGVCRMDQYSATLPTPDPSGMTSGSKHAARCPSAKLHFKIPELATHADKKGHLLCKSDSRANQAGECNILERSSWVQSSRATRAALPQTYRIKQRNSHQQSSCPYSRTAWETWLLKIEPVLSQAACTPAMLSWGGGTE